MTSVPWCHYVSLSLDKPVEVHQLQWYPGKSAPQRKIQKPGGPSPALSAPSWAIHWPTLSNCFVSFGFGAYHDRCHGVVRRGRHAKVRGTTNGSTYEVGVKISEPGNTSRPRPMWFDSEKLPPTCPWPTASAALSNCVRHRTSTSFRRLTAPGKSCTQQKNGFRKPPNLLNPCSICSFSG